MAQQRPIAVNEDPVCGMTVDIEQARAKGLVRTHEGREFVFCGKGCFLEFGEEPAKYLAPDYVPEM